MDNDKSDARPAQRERDLAPGSIEPPQPLPLYRLFSPSTIAVARALRSSEDAWALRQWLTRADLGEERLAQLFERVVWFYAGGRGAQRELLAELSLARWPREGIPLYRLAVELARLPDWLLSSAGSARDIATAVKFGARAFRPPHATRRSAAA